MQWIDQLKIAVIEKDEEKIENLISTLPKFDSLEQMKEAAYIMQEAYNFLSAEKDQLADKLVKIKKQKEFLNTASMKPSSFDQTH